MAARPAPLLYQVQQLRRCTADRRYGLLQLTVGVDGAPFARNPKVTEPPAGIAALYATLLTDTLEPLVVSVPLHTCVMLCPLASVQCVVQPEMALAPAVTTTWPWKPPGQELAVL